MMKKTLKLEKKSPFFEIVSKIKTKRDILWPSQIKVQIF